MQHWIIRISLIKLGVKRETFNNSNIKRLSQKASNIILKYISDDFEEKTRILKVISSENVKYSGFMHENVSKCHYFPFQSIC